jgi:hypothetical protein
MTLLQSTYQFLEQVEQFYHGHDGANQYKLLAIECARNEVKAIEACDEYEHPMRIVNIRRMLANTLPHMGYEEGMKLEKSLNAILESCREQLKLVQN